jgi:hypothetical protein
MLFWASFILTRPLGATVGDFLDKPISDGGLNLADQFLRRSSRYSSSVADCCCHSAPGYTPGKTEAACIRKPERRPSFDGSGVSEIQPHAVNYFWDCVGFCSLTKLKKEKQVNPTS